MAIYYLDVKPIGGNSCRSAVGAAAYRAGEKLYNENDGITHDYTKRRGAVGAAAYRSGEDINDGNIAHDFTQKGGIVYSEIMLPKHALEAYQDRSTLCNAMEKAERNCNARTGREIVIALPNELTPEQQIKVTRDYVQRNFVDEGMCADYSLHSGHIHEKKGEIYPFKDLTVRKDNPHVHIQLTVRPINADGTWGAKSKKEYILDKNGDRIKLPSGEWKSRKIETTDWDKKETLLKWREDWAVTVNKEFERLGIDERISHLSLKEQGINREPTKHMGHEAWNLEKKGIKTEIGDKNRAVMARNKALEQLEKETRKHEPSMREKLTIIRNKHGINHESTTQISPENTAEYMHELKQGYVILDKEISTIQQESLDIRHEIKSSQFKIEEITERAEYINTLKGQLEELEIYRKKMKFYENKKAINEYINNAENSYKQADSYFKQQFDVTPEESAAKVKQLEYKIKDMEHIQERLQENIKSHIADRNIFELEYKRQKLFSDVSLDKQRIQDRLTKLDKGSHLQKESPKDKLMRAQSERVLSTVTEKQFQAILNEVKPEQAMTLIARREKELEREINRNYSRRL